MPVNRISLGQVVKSVAGRDAGHTFLVVGLIPPTFVLVADGRSRGADKPKRKNVRHLSVLKFIDAGVVAKVTGGQQLTDLEIRTALKAAVGTDSPDADEEGDSCPSKTS